MPFNLIKVAPFPSSVLCKNRRRVCRATHAWKGTVESLSDCAKVWHARNEEAGKAWRAGRPAFAPLLARVAWAKDSPGAARQAFGEWHRWRCLGIVSERQPRASAATAACLPPVSCAQYGTPSHARDCLGEEVAVS